MGKGLLFQISKIRFTIQSYYALMESLGEEASIKTWQAGRQAGRGISAFSEAQHLPYLKLLAKHQNLNKIENSTTKYTINHVAIMTNIVRERERLRERERERVDCGRRN